MSVKWLKDVKFPDCYSKCKVVKYLGCGECESVCPDKFLQESKEPETHHTTDQSLKCFEECDEIANNQEECDECFKKGYVGCPRYFGMGV